jgi:ankyrin repeat protein
MKSLMSYVWRVAPWMRVMNRDVALRRAAWRGSTETVKALLEAGADVHGEQDAALQKASANGHADTVKVLLAAGADVHAADELALRPQANTARISWQRRWCCTAGLALFLSRREAGNR